MTKTRLLIAVGTLVALAGAGFVAVLMMPDGRPGVTKANFDRIEQRMTATEVIAILGEPAIVPQRTPHEPIQIWWRHDDGTIILVDFTEDAVVTSKEISEPTESLTDKIRRWLHLP